MPKPRVCIFEDKDKNFRVLNDALAADLGDDFSVERYPGEKHDSTADVHAADVWVKTFMTEPEPATLAIIDWDLTEFQHAVSRPLVRAIAEDTSTPVVMYQGADPNLKAAEKLRRWQERRIAIEGTVDHVKVAAKSADVARGFKMIWDRVGSLDGTPRLLETLRDILKPPSSAPLHLEQFAVGSQELLGLFAAEDGPERGDLFRLGWDT